LGSPADAPTSERDRDRDRDGDSVGGALSGMAGVSAVAQVKARPASSSGTRSRSRDRESSQRERRPPPGSLVGSGSFSGVGNVPSKRVPVRSSSRGSLAPGGAASADSSPRLPGGVSGRRPGRSVGAPAAISNGHAAAESKSSWASALPKELPAFARAKTLLPSARLARDREEPSDEPGRGTALSRTKSAEATQPAVARPLTRINLPRAFDDPEDVPRQKVAEADLGDFLSQLKNSGDVVAGNRSQFIKRAGGGAGGSSRRLRNRGRDRSPDLDEDDG